MITINWHPSPREMRQWAGLLAVALGLVGSLFYFLEWGIFRGGEGLAKFLWAFGTVAFVTGATGSKAGLPAYWAWMGFIYAVSWVIGRCPGFSLLSRGHAACGGCPVDWT
jgi:hypothetical protein